MSTWADVERVGLALPETWVGTSWNRPTVNVNVNVNVNDRWFVLDREPRPDALDDVAAPLEGLIVLSVEDEEATVRLAADDSGYFLTSEHCANSRMILRPADSDSH